jgi:sucrose-6-phosphate hydrolase SacC (GH32 family)
MTQKQYEGYLFVHFTGEGQMGEQVYFSISKDGLYWKDLNQGKPVLISNVGEKGVRDPFIIKSPKENKYYIIATDLRIASGKGWDAAQLEGSKNIVVWESEDLLHWSEERMCEVGIPSAGCVWAPEAIYDEQKEMFLVFWASRVKKSDETQSKQRIYACYTKDFRSFTEVEEYLERENHVIDTTILAIKNLYYRFSKDETTKNIRMDVSNSLHKDSFIDVSAQVLEKLLGVEGPAAFKFNDREEWCLMVDQFAAKKGYLPLVTTDLSTGDFRILDANEYDLGKTIKRHGSILNLTKEEYDLLWGKWGDKTQF